VPQSSAAAGGATTRLGRLRSDHSEATLDKGHSAKSGDPARILGLEGAALHDNHDRRGLRDFNLAVTAAYGISNELRNREKRAAGIPLKWREEHYWQYLGIWFTVAMYLVFSLVYTSFFWPLHLGTKSYHRPAGMTPGYCQSVGGFWDGALCEPNDNWSPTRDQAKIQRFEDDPLIKAQNAQ
jgi:hypothetical protein